ncbi:hypothetical protein OPQ81_011668 [Rhizoctonia solani]|nr:hypothetical protein OPQ81_011668 [Rhizoctonia solani]
MGSFLSTFFIFPLINRIFRRRDTHQETPVAVPAEAPAREVISSEKWEDIRSREPSAPVLIFGSFDSPKADFIKTASTIMETKPEPNPPGSDVTIQHTVVDGHPYKLINTPGFDNPRKSNLEVFMDIAQYLQSGEFQSGVKGLIYVHDASHPLHSKALAENLNVLFSVLLGQSALRFLTIVVVPFQSAGLMENANSIAARMQADDSAFSVAHKAGARIITSGFEETDVLNIVRTSTVDSFFQLHIQLERLDNLQELIELALGYSYTNSVKAALAHQEETTTQAYRPDLEATQKKLEAVQKALEETRRSLGETKQTAERYQDAYKQIEVQLGTEQKRAQELSRRLQETQSEYSSLRSQLQIQENVEQSEIVLGLKDLNRAIEDIGRAFSAHFADHYAAPAFDKDPMDVTTLDARDLTALQMAFGHLEGDASFVKSSSGAGMMAEDFFDYGIRHLLCSFLWQHVFNVFHPKLDEAFNQTLSGIYQDIRLREPQAVTGKWRVNSFLGIESDGDRDQARDTVISSHVNKFCEGIKVLAQAFFGQDQGIQIEPAHSGQVEKLFQMAWQWNTKLKGEVIVLGDFFQTYYEPRSAFEPETMEEFEPRKGFKAEKILGTLGLGLISVQAVGGGQPPEKTIVCKASVATESLYN